MDLPAYGLTDTTPRIADNLRYSAVRFLVEVLDGLELDAPSFVANSLGSLWTSWLAIDSPERLSTIVHVGCPALVLDSSAPLPMRFLSVKSFGWFWYRLQPPSERQVERLSKMVNEYPLAPEVADLLLATERLPGFRRTFLSTLHALFRLHASRLEMRLTADQLERIGHPTVVFWGKNDPFGSPEVGERMVGIMPAAELYVVDAGHAPWLRQAEQIGPTVERFFRRHAP